MLGRPENRFQRRDVGDHLLLRHRIWRAAAGGFGECLEIGEHRFGRRKFAHRLLLVAKMDGQGPAARRFGMRLVAHLGPALAPIDGEAAVERRREDRAEKRVAAAFEVHEDAERIAIDELAAERLYRSEYPIGDAEDADREV